MNQTYKLTRPVAPVGEYVSFVIVAPSSGAAREYAAVYTGDKRWLEPSFTDATVFHSTGGESAPGTVLASSYIA